MAKKLPELNTASVADISFLLLTFFLLTSSIDTDKGIPRLLPPPPIEVKDIEIKQRNVFQVLINTYDQLLVQKQPGNIKTLRKQVKEFILNENNSPNLPEKELKNIKFIGPYYVSKGVVSLQNDRGTSYKMYMAVQNEIVAAFNELRDELSIKHFGRKYSELVNPEHQKAIREAIPLKISEAEPKDVGGSK